MSFPRYERYRDSDSAEYGLVPEAWKTTSLRRILARKVSDGPHETPVFVDEGVPFLSVDGIQDGELIFEGCRYISREAHEIYRSKIQPQRDDLLLAKAASTGKIARVKTDREFNIWSPLAVIRIDQRLALPGFVEYLLKSPQSQAQIEQLCTSNTQRNISMDDIPKLFALCPPIFEQHQIVFFLDHETANIDALIEEQRRLIVLLKEKRQAVISHAVTKGLNPAAPMKDSGIEWLCEVPAHWGLKRLKQLAAKITDGEHISPALAEEGVPLLSAKDVRDWTVDYNVDKYVSVNDAKQFWKRCRPERGDILVVSRGATVGRVGVVDGFIDFCLMGSVILCKPTEEYESDFLYYALNAKHSQTSLWFSSDSSAQQAIYIQDVADVPIPVPPLAERTEIAAFLKDEIAKLDTLAAEAQRATNMLQERRSALISAAVTGKIDVRNYSPRETPTHEEVYEPA